MNIRKNNITIMLLFCSSGFGGPVSACVGIVVDGDNSSTPPKYDRIKWNKEIQDVCFDAIVNEVEKC